MTLYEKMPATFRMQPRYATEVLYKAWVFMDLAENCMGVDSRLESIYVYRLRGLYMYFKLAELHPQPYLIPYSDRPMCLIQYDGPAFQLSNEQMRNMSAIDEYVKRYGPLSFCWDAVYVSDRFVYVANSIADTYGEAIVMANNMVGSREQRLPYSKEDLKKWHFTNTTAHTAQA